jgi:hypothetical protein
MKRSTSWWQRRFALVASIGLAATQMALGQTLVEDGFDGPAGALPDATKFEWSGEVAKSGTGQLTFHTNAVSESWLKSKASALPGEDGQPLVLTMRAYSYAEYWSPGVYGNKQPRGLRAGSDANNAIEFYSAARTSIGMRVRKDGVESSATHAFPAGVDSMRDYEIRVTKNLVVFKVDGNVTGSFATNIPTGTLNLYVSTSDGGAGNVPISLDHVSLATTPPATRILGLDGNLTFGKVRRLGSATSILTITNSGNAPLTVSGIEYPEGFSGPWSGAIAAGASHEVTVTFQPTAVLDYGGTVTVHSDMTSGTSTIAVSGSGADPQIQVEQPTETVLANESIRDFGATLIDEELILSFTLRNVGNWPLSDLTTSFLGTHADDFEITNPLPSQVDEDGSTAFEIRFSASSSGQKWAILRISSDDPQTPAFDILLSGQALSAADDSDDDGMNDAAEHKLAALGLDWTIPQPSLVSAYFAESSRNGLFNRDQIKAMRPSMKLLGKNPASGRFTLSVGLLKSTDLRNFQPTPLLAPQIHVLDDGNLEYEFASPEPAAFFRLELK